MSTLPRKDLFDLPEGVIYLDGNSLGPLPKSVRARVADVIGAEWGTSLIRGWNDAGWMDQPGRVGDLVAALIGAPEGSVMMGDTLSIKVYQALAAALEMRPDRKVVLSDSGNFPTDLYMAKGLLTSLGQGHELRIVDPEDVAGAMDETVAAVMLTEVDYRTGRKHDMTELTRRAHDAGAVMIWDLAHSAGALPVDLTGSRCEFAVGCSYKYLNGGPGAPAFIYVRPDILDHVRPALSGWMGHDAPFAFDLEYRPASGVERMRVGTPPVLQMSALEEAMSVWKGVTMDEIRAASIRLSERFIQEVEARCPELVLASPRDPAMRGSQVSFAFAEGYAAMQALIARGVIGDFRAPDIIRFGFTPLYLDEDDIVAAAGILQDIMANRLWDDPAYKTANKVT
ncbi:kynureninase [Rhodophyticola porphyridii]|uniref:Kynureninase n=1 Tax=Rhodophyticola porphyridii TaxID=1852017 RepID=A0A3L9YAS2_9RHOB|nr:kynureninase [Rhodophyticola porphyridii]RMA43066.1 kynureninase [Rhodophyticola porphyridii]